MNTPRFILSIWVVFLTTGCSDSVKNMLSNASFSENSNFISGSLDGTLISSAQSSGLSKTSSFKSSCGSYSINLYTLDSQDQLSPTPTLSSTVSSDGSFNLGPLPEALGAKVEKVSYVLKVEGCGVEYSRPVTGPFDQNISMASSLLMLSAQIPEASRVRVSEMKVKNIELAVESMRLTTSSTLTAFIDQVVATSSLSAAFTALTNIAATRLKTLPPSDFVISGEAVLHEGVASVLTVTAASWNTNFPIAYQWKVDGVVKSTTDRLTFVPGSNAQGEHQLTVSIGTNDGQGKINFSLPVSSRMYTMNVIDDVPAKAPAITLAEGSLVKTRMISVLMGTGISMENCDSFSKLALTENEEAVPAAEDFHILCNSPGTQNILYSLASPSDGLKSLRLWAIDGAGKISPSASRLDITLDSTKPLSQFPNPLASLSKSNSQSFSFSATDLSGINKMECSLDAGAWTVCVSPWTVGGLTDGTHVFSTRSTDLAGNVSDGVFQTWVADLTAPLATLAGLPNGMTNLTSAQFTFSGTDAGSGVSGFECALDGQPFTACSSNSSLLLTAGSHHFQVVALDLAGNRSLPVGHSWTVDLNPPVLSLVSKPDVLTAVKNAVFSFTATDSGGSPGITFRCQLDANVSTVCTSPISYSSLSEGVHQFLVTATDTAGNVSTPAYYSWTVDSNPPLLTITSPANNGTLIPTASLASFSLSGSCTENLLSVKMSGFIYTPAFCSNGTWTTFLDLSTMADGTISFTVNQTDNAGNLGNSNIRTVIKDTVAPIQTVTSPLAGTPLQSAVTLTGTCEVGRTIAFTGIGLAATATNPCAGGNFTQSLNFSAGEGSKPISLSQTDVAGNTGTTSIALIRDNTPPILTIAAPVGGSILQNQAAVSGSCETSAGMVSVDGPGVLNSVSAACAAGSYSVLVSLSPSDGTKQMSARQTDSAGNQATINVSVMRDATPPTLTLTSPAAGAYLQSSLVLTGACESGVQVLATGDGLLQALAQPCTNGSYSISATLSAGEGSKNVVLTSTDAAGNVATLNRSFSKDSTPPTLTSNVVSPYVTQLAASNLNGTCETGLPVQLAGDLTATVPCTNSTWSFTVNLTTPDSWKTLSFSQTDGAGNVSTLPMIIVQQISLSYVAPPVLSVDHLINSNVNVLKGSVLSWSITPLSAAPALSTFGLSFSNGNLGGTVGCLATGGSYSYRVNGSNAYTSTNIDISFSVASCNVADYVAPAETFAGENAGFYAYSPDPNLGTNALFNVPSEGPIDENKRISVSGGRFYRANGTRARLFGVNLSFGTNFRLTNAEINSLMARLRAMGVNSVRLTALDAPWGYYLNDKNDTVDKSIWDNSGNCKWPTKKDAPTVCKSTRILSEARLVQLDYLVNALKTNGIYIDLPVHMSRTFGYNDPINSPTSFVTGYNPYTVYFDPDQIALQKEYATQIFNRINTYSGIRYGDDPVFGHIEILNENSLLQGATAGEWIYQQPPFYQNQIYAKWNAFLQSKYGTHAALVTAWNGVDTSTTTNLVTNPDFSGTNITCAGTLTPGWSPNVVDAAKGSIEIFSATGMPFSKYVSLKNINQDVAFKLQLYQGKTSCYPLTLNAGKPYTIEFYAKSNSVDSSAPLVVYLQDTLGVAHCTSDLTVKPTSTWTKFKTVQSCSRTVAGPYRLLFSFGGTANFNSTIDVGGIKLSAGYGFGATENLALGNISWPLGYPGDSAYSRDKLEFLSSVEKTYCQTMRDHVRTSLNVNVPVSCSQIVFGDMMSLSREIQSGMDYTDNHAYWDHPVYPSCVDDPNDPDDTCFGQSNTPQVTSPIGGASLTVARGRPYGKPHSVSEYNHASPNVYSSDTLPFLVGTGLSQDLDSVHMFDYAGDTAALRGNSVKNYFSTAQNPGKLIYYPVASALFRSTGTESSAATTAIMSGTSDEMTQSFSFNNSTAIEKAWNTVFTTNQNTLLNSKLYLKMEPGFGVRSSSDTPFSLQTSTDSSLSGNLFSWTTSGADGVFKFGVPKGAGYVATNPTSALVDLGSMTFTPQAGQAYISMAAASLDGNDLNSSNKILIAMTGRTQNIGQTWKNISFGGKSYVTTAHNSGGNWGDQSQLEAIKGSFTLKTNMNKNNFEVLVLGKSGEIRGKLHYTQDASQISFTVDQSQWRSPWIMIRQK